MEFEESGSEMGDAMSTTTKLDVISKEKLYSAYRTTIERYQKYRNRYLDLVTKFRDLERDSSKARVSVANNIIDLVELLICNDAMNKNKKNY